MVTCIVCAVGFFSFYPQALKYLGVIHYKLHPGNGELWFMDLFAILASNDAVSAGMDPYAPNSLDYLQRAHVYPHWWLNIRHLGVTRADCIWLGLVFGTCFLLAVVARLRPQSAGETLWYIVGVCSPPVLLALERANNDIIIFLILAPVPLCLTAKREMIRIIAVPLIAAAAALKTYPIVGLIVLIAGADRQELVRRWVLVIIICAFLGFDLARDWPQFGRKVPDMRGLLSFGAAHGLILLGLGVTKAKVVAVLIGVAAFVILLKIDLLARWSISSANRRAWLFFVLGATLLTGCFYAGTSFAYRWIFALWMLPFIWRLLLDSTTPERVHRLAIATSTLLMVMLWFSGIAIALLIQFDAAFQKSTTDRSDVIVAMGQPLIWAFFLCLLIFLAHFIRESFAPYWKRERADS
jgi:hypothetical protein